MHSHITTAIKSLSAVALAQDPGSRGSGSLRRRDNFRAARWPLLSLYDAVVQRMIGERRMGKVYQALLVSDNRTIAVEFVREEYHHQLGVAH